MEPTWHKNTPTPMPLRVGAPYPYPSRGEEEKPQCTTKEASVSSRPDNMPPDCWEELNYPQPTVVPHSFWVRWRGEVVIFEVIDGVVRTPTGSLVSPEMFRAVLKNMLGPEGENCE
jgi:hypothetical protein